MEERDRTKKDEPLRVSNANSWFYRLPWHFEKISQCDSTPPIDESMSKTVGPGSSDGIFLGNKIRYWSSERAETLPPRLPSRTILRKRKSHPNPNSVESSLLGFRVTVVELYKKWVSFIYFALPWILKKKLIIIHKLLIGFVFVSFEFATKWPACFHSRVYKVISGFKLFRTFFAFSKFQTFKIPF